MKKACLLICCFLFAGTFLKAQVKQAYYPRKILSEDVISKSLENARKGGSDEKEIQQLRAHLYQLYQKLLCC